MSTQYIHHWLKYTAALCVLLCFTAHASNMEELHKKQGQLKQLYIDLERNNIGYMTKKIELETTESKLRRLKRNAENERRALDDMIKAQEKSPKVDYSDKIESQRLEWRKSNKLYLSQKEFVRILYDKVADDKIQYKVTQQRIANLRDSIDSTIEAMAESELNKELSNLRKSQKIKSTTVETCSLSVTKDDCLDKARVRAERDAAERGSLVVIDAVTEVKNFNLTKDEARSRVSARISNIEVFKKSFDLTDDKTGWRVEYGITATVTPAIHDEMRNQLKRQIIATFNINIPYREASTRDLPEYIEVPPEEENVSAYIAPVAPVEVITEKTNQRLRDETEREMQEIRDVATSKAATKEESEAKEELDSRSISIMVF